MLAVFVAGLLPPEPVTHYFASPPCAVVWFGGARDSRLTRPVAARLLVRVALKTHIARFSPFSIGKIKVHKSPIDS